MKKTCKNCGQEYQYRHSDYCCSSCFWVAVNKDKEAQFTQLEAIPHECEKCGTIVLQYNSSDLKNHKCKTPPSLLYHKIIQFEERLQKHECLINITPLKQQINQIRNDYADNHEDEIYKPKIKEVNNNV